MHENSSQLNTQKVSPLGPMAATAKEQKENIDGTKRESKEGNKDTQLHSCSFCQDGAVGNGWQSGHHRTRVHHPGVSQVRRGEGRAINYFPHADIKKPEVFYENNTVQQMNSIPFLK